MVSVNEWRLVQGLDAEVRIERVGQAPGQHLAARPIHGVGARKQVFVAALAIVTAEGA